MPKKIPINQTYLLPYINAAFLFIEHGVGRFVDKIGDYGIQIKKHNEPGEYKIFVNFAFENHVFDQKIYFYIKETDNFETLNLKLESVAEQIYRTILHL